MLKRATSIEKMIVSWSFLDVNIRKIYIILVFGTFLIICRKNSNKNYLIVLTYLYNSFNLHKTHTYHSDIKSWFNLQKKAKEWYIHLHMSQYRSRIYQTRNNKVLANKREFQIFFKRKMKCNPCVIKHKWINMKKVTHFIKSEIYGYYYNLPYL